MNTEESLPLGTEESDLVQAHFKQAYELFLQCAFVEGEAVLCQLHDAFGTLDTPHHNCLGCNFADSTELILNFLSTYSMQQTIHNAFSTFIILAYLLVERIDTLLNIIEINQEYRNEHFKVLSSIRRWANFLKHPKAFILTHHPSFTFIGSPGARDMIRNAEVPINGSFVQKFYSNDERNKELNEELENKENVVVIFPSAIELCEDLCNAMNVCISVIRDNKVYKEVLESRSTFYDYWADYSGA